jgi:hypothetical protein
MKTIKVIIGIIIAFFSTKTIFEMYNEESGAGLFGAFSGYIIFMAIAIWLIYSGSKDEVTKVKNVNLENDTNSAKNYDKNRTDIANLKDLKEKDLLTDEEYNKKVSKIEQEKKEENLKNSQEYKQLKSLLDSGILTKDEFDDKLIVLKTLKPTKSDIEKQDFKIIKTEEISTFKDGRIEVFKIYHKKDEYYFYEIEKNKRVFISIENNKKYFNNRNEFLDYFKEEII